MEKEVKKYWKGLDELEGKTLLTGEFVSTPLREEQEQQVHREHNDGKTAERREFLKLMGASLAMLGASACTRRPVEKIVPYVKKPEELTPGIANWYASTCQECSASCGVLVKTREGRPIKFEGNVHHPFSQGGLCARGQASVLNLYDPDRLKHPVRSARKAEKTPLLWDELDQDLVKKLKHLQQTGGNLRVLTGEILSPSTNKLIGDFLSGFKNSKHVVYEPLNAEEVMLANELTYGRGVVPHYRLDRANVVLSFGADFLGNWLSSVELSKGFSKTRKLHSPKTMSKFIAFESLVTLTGTNADERHSIKSGDEYKAALALASELVVNMGKTRYAGDSLLGTFLKKYDPKSIALELGVDAAVFKKYAHELWDARGRSVVFGGGYSVKGAAGLALEVATNFLNSALENEGNTVDGAVNYTFEKNSTKALVELISEMDAGKVDVLLVYKTNPAYSLPPVLGFEKALAKVKTIVAFSTHLDETARLADVALASHHDLENWGDANPKSGFYSIQQPTISPLAQTRSFEDSLLQLGRKLSLGGVFLAASNWHEYLKENWKETIYRRYNIVAPFALFWESVLREGFFDGVASEGMRGLASTKSRSFNVNALVSFSYPKSLSASTLVLYPNIAQHDGRTANNSWLQELPDPVTKITWDNYLSVSASYAKAQNLSDGDIVKVKVGEQTLELPVYIQPGQNDKTVAMALGYGRQAAGRVGTGVGVNGFVFAAQGQKLLEYSNLSFSLEKTGRTYVLASTQKHHSLEGRPIVREATLKEFQQNSKAGNEEIEHDMTLWKPYEYKGYRWGMAIDLNACTGCGACVMACQAENNVPVVGRDFVRTGREMHWMRIDRYYAGNSSSPEVVHQPMICQHCENAPCETVCPVLATMHDHEGLNQQIYNRCVGTRYCSNNCPYKVRRFNWFTFTDVPTPMQLVYNPDITVRTRGIMEKCTFCIQRIREVKDKAKDFNRLVQDGEIKTACEQSCPTDAIVFGNVNDKESRVTKLSQNPRGYRVLSELNTKPSVTYLTKIRNKA